MSRSDRAPAKVFAGRLSEPPAILQAEFEGMLANAGAGP